MANRQASIRPRQTADKPRRRRWNRTSWSRLEEKPKKFLRNALGNGCIGYVDVRIKDGKVVGLKEDEEDDKEKIEEKGQEGKGGGRREFRGSKFASKTGGVRSGATSNEDGYTPEPQGLGTVRIFLNASEGSIGQLQDYLEFGEDWRGDEGAQDEKGADGEDNDVDDDKDEEDRAHLPYDLADLSGWLHREGENTQDTMAKELEQESGITLPPQRLDISDSARTIPIERDEARPRGMLLDEADAVFTFTELFSDYASSKYANLVQHKLYFFDDANDKERFPMIVWRCCSPRYWSNISRCQQWFLNCLQLGNSTLQKSVGSAPSLSTFLARFILEVLYYDVGVFEDAVKSDLDNKYKVDLTDTSGLVVTGFKVMEDRIQSFNRIKHLVEKAEDVRDTCTFLSANTSHISSPPFRKETRTVLLRCGTLLKQTKRIDGRYQDQFLLNTTVSQSRQSFYVTILTILAAVFLPLSLASAVLSMQTRFQDLGVLIYDFFGVAWLFCTFALIACLAVRKGNQLFDDLWRVRHIEKQKYQTWKNSIEGVIWSYIVAWTFLLVSFLLGMFLKPDMVDWRAYPFLGIGVFIAIVSPWVIPFFEIVFTVLCLFASCHGCFGWRGLEEKVQRQPGGKRGWFGRKAVRNPKESGEV